MTIAIAAPHGVVLAGGLSRRMGGGDKGLIELGGKPMLAHVIGRLDPQVSQVAINANGDPSRFAQFGLPVVPDPVQGFVGPLAGVLAGLKWARDAATGASWVVSVSADAPLVPKDLVVRLAEAAGQHRAAIAMAQSLDGLHPVIGLWPVALADDLEAALKAGVRKVLDWTDRHRTVPVTFDPIELGGVEIDPFFNANTPQELEQLRHMLAAADGWS